MSTRDQAIAHIVEKLREIEAESDKAWQAQDAWFKGLPDSPLYRSTEEILSHGDARDLHYAVAQRCEQLIEEINGNLLFDQLDANAAEYEEKLKARAEVEQTAANAPLLSQTPLAAVFGATRTPYLMCVRCGIGDRDTVDGRCGRCVAEDGGEI